MWLFIRKRYIFLLSLALFGTAIWWFGIRSSEQESLKPIASQARLGAPLFNHFGHYHHAISTKSPLAQRYFDQGLILFYGFNYAESIRSFREAVRLDPHCGMCYWGLALALGSKTNSSNSGDERKEAAAAIKKAMSLSSKTNLVERAYIEALWQRYSAKLSKTDLAALLSLDCSHCHQVPAATKEELQAYAQAMKSVVEAYPHDVDAKILYAAALLDAEEWELYGKDKTAKPSTSEVLSTLEEAIALEPKNPAAHHFYIHAVEGSDAPERGLASAHLLRYAVPGIDQFIHIPSHIYFAVGRYHDATVVNQKAVAAYKEYVGESWMQGFEPARTFLQQRNLYFITISAMMEGRKKLTISMADELARQTPATQAKGSHLELYYAVPYFARVRFGLWDDLLEEPEPPVEFRFQKAMWHYARGMAFAHLNNADQALRELVILRDITSEDVAAGRFGTLQEKIAVEVLAATISDVLGDDWTTLEHWTRAVMLEEVVGTRRPPLWHFPVREGLASALLLMNRPKDAEEEYKHLLQQYPESGWALFGLAECMRIQGNVHGAEAVQRRFEKAWSHADVSLPIQSLPTQSLRSVL